MPRKASSIPSAARLGDRLAAARRARFVGRGAELALFRAALRASEPPFAVLYVHGPGGVGKTTLVHEYMRLAQEAGRGVVRLDARDLEPSPEVFMAALRHSATGGPPDGVLVVDTYETLAPLDAWLREVFLPQIPAGTLVVLSGRMPPAAAWTTDAAWAALTRVVALGNFGPEDGAAYLAMRGVPEARHAEVLVLTYGHPLTLSLAADAVAHGGTGAVDLGSDPDVVRVLLENFARDVPSSRHRLALCACAFAAATTAPLLAAALDVEDAGEYFDWLGGLSFIEHGPRGLFPHDLAREVLYADSRRRSPDVRRTLNERILMHLYGKFQREQGVEQQRTWFEIIYLQRYSAGLRPYLVWTSVNTVYADPLHPGEEAAILAMVERHEGEASRKIARHWLDRQPEGFSAFRDLAGELIGFMACLRLEHASAEDLKADPAAAAALDFVQRHGALRPGEGLAHSRFFMTRDAYQELSPAMNVLAANSSLYWTTHPELAWNFISVADPEYFTPFFHSIHVWRAAESDFEVGGRRYGVFAHDWRIEPLDAWIRAKVDRATYDDAQAAPPAALAVLSQEDFAEAVRQALRDYARPERLGGNPLLRTRLVAARNTEAGVEQLRALLLDAANALNGHPKDTKLHLALWHTYLQPAPTQERAAALLDLPFNTYRYHLAKGTERVAQWLWARELHDSSVRAR